MTQALKSSDHQLKSAITDELCWAPRVNADQIGVAVTDGAVTLSGQVYTYPEKQAAVRAARRVRGATAVADEIVVQHEFGEMQDADIARAAGLAFDRTVVVPAGSVTATVHNHVITLAGTVDWQYQREEAQRAVATLPGVRGLHNTIAVAPEAVVSPAEAKTEIMAALRRNAQVDADRIEVAVTGERSRCWAHCPPGPNATRPSTRPGALPASPTSTIGSASRLEQGVCPAHGEGVSRRVDGRPPRKRRPACGAACPAWPATPTRSF